MYPRRSIPVRIQGTMVWNNKVKDGKDLSEAIDPGPLDQEMNGVVSSNCQADTSRDSRCQKRPEEQRLAGNMNVGTISCSTSERKSDPTLVKCSLRRAVMRGSVSKDIRAGRVCCFIRSHPSFHLPVKGVRSNGFFGITNTCRHLHRDTKYHSIEIKISPSRH